MTNMDRYVTNKNMYRNLSSKKTINLLPMYDFYFTHSVVGGEKTLYKILKDGYLRPGKTVDHKNILSTGDLEYVFANINFSRRSRAQPGGDLNNVDVIGNISLQFSPMLLFDQQDTGIIFNRGWFAGPVDTSIWINGSDSLEQKYNKLNQIKEYLKNPTFYPKKLIQDSGYRAHEIMINKPIPLNQYMISINMVGANKYRNRIHKIIEKKYPNVKILECEKDMYGLSIAPSLKNIVNK